MHNQSTEVFPTKETQANNASALTPTKGKDSVSKGLSFLEQYLALWIFVAIVLGILFGCFVSGTQNVLNTSKSIGPTAPIGANSFIPLQLAEIL